MAERETSPGTPLDELVSIRDWLRYAVSRFNAAGLVFGHGTANALDEAAYLILHTLHLPIDQLDPWLEARLLASERAAVREIIERRIATRKPAPYLTHEAWIGGHSFYVDERVIVPRSYIGELLCRQMEAPAGEWHLGFDPRPRGRGPGSVHGLGLPRHPGRLDVSRRDGRRQRRLGGCPRASPSAMWATTAWRSASRSCSPTCSPRMLAGATISSWPIRPTSAPRRWPLFPPEYAAEPAIAHAGGTDGLDLVRRILAEAGDHLSPDGHAAGRDRHGPRRAGAAVPAAAVSCGWTRPRARARSSRSAAALRAAALAAAVVVSSPRRRLLALLERARSMADTNPFHSTERRPHIEGPYQLEEVRLANRNYGILLEALRHDVTPTGLHYLLNHFDVPYVPDSRWQVEVAGLRGAACHGVARRDHGYAVTHACRHAGVRRQRPRRHDPALPEHALDQRGGGHGAMDRHPASACARSRLACATMPWTSPSSAPTAASTAATSTTSARSLKREEALQRRRAARLGHERRAAAAAARLSAAPDRARLVRHGEREVADAHRGPGDSPSTASSRSRGYHYRSEPDGPRTPITHMRVKSLLVPPGIPDWYTRRRLVDAGPLTLVGRAWSGGGVPIAKVEVGIDGAWRDGRARSAAGQVRLARLALALERRARRARAVLPRHRRQRRDAAARDAAGTPADSATTPCIACASR